MSEMTSATFKAVKEVSFVELWDAVFGCDGAGMTWCSMIRKTNGQGISLWKKNEEGDLIANPQDFKVYDQEAEKWHTCTLEDLANGYVLASNAGQTHCGHYQVSDLEDYDACTGDMIVQYAIFGELIYG
jgi:hypothetical protein